MRCSLAQDNTDTERRNSGNISALLLADVACICFAKLLVEWLVGVFSHSPSEPFS